MANLKNASHGHEANSAGEHGNHGSLKSYVIGFVLSIVLTIVPLVAVLGADLGQTTTLIVILAAAVLQFAIQLLFFMHLREGENARWNVMSLLLGILILVTIVGGSIWIMTYNAVAH
ncbi:cytochrome o ubiquinol oxidase subunit IV [Paenibacillus sp.]|uniref:cytochrome o ubiquinol oxidase subunit IV n=1 Tax=Paenibacillus sp. TaxID=58172 RepID=UPI00281240E7|nr:cytochrome o ubiquinol oxidase subunit IV [Paenibacillus sp.]